MRRLENRFAQTYDAFVYLTRPADLLGDEPSVSGGNVAGLVSVVGALIRREDHSEGELLLEAESEAAARMYTVVLRLASRAGGGVSSGNGARFLAGTRIERGNHDPYGIEEIRIAGQQV